VPLSNTRIVTYTPTIGIRRFDNNPDTYRQARRALRTDPAASNRCHTHNTAITHASITDDDDGDNDETAINKSFDDVDALRARRRGDDSRRRTRS
jgi:hypothetical protein